MIPSRLFVSIVAIVLAGCSQQYIDTVKSSTTKFAPNHKIGEVLDNRTQCTNISWEYAKDKESNRVVTYKCELEPNGIRDRFSQTSQVMLDPHDRNRPPENIYLPRITEDFNDSVRSANKLLESLKVGTDAAILELEAARNSGDPYITSFESRVEKMTEAYRQAEADLPSEMQRLEESRERETQRAREERAAFDELKSVHTQALAELGPTVEKISWVIDEDGTPIPQTSVVELSFSEEIQRAPLISLDIHIAELIKGDGKTGSEFGSLLNYMWQLEIQKRSKSIVW